MTYSFDVDKWMKERKTKRIAKCKQMDKLGKYFKHLEYKYLRVSYQGSGDSGEAFTTEGWKDDSWNELVGLDYQEHNYGSWDNEKQKYIMKPGETKWTTLTRNQKQILKAYDSWKKEHPDSKLSSDISYVLVDLIDYDWYNNEGGQGCVIWDLEAGQVYVDGEQNVYAHRTATEKYFVNGDDPEYGYGDKVEEN